MVLMIESFIRLKDILVQKVSMSKKILPFSHETLKLNAPLRVDTIFVSYLHHLIKSSQVLEVLKMTTKSMADIQLIRHSWVKFLFENIIECESAQLA